MYVLANVYKVRVYTCTCSCTIMCFAVYITSYSVECEESMRRAHNPDLPFFSTHQRFYEGDWPDLLLGQPNVGAGFSSIRTHFHNVPVDPFKYANTYCGHMYQ